MNSSVKEILRKANVDAKKYEFYDNAVIYTTYDDLRYVAKENDNDILEVYNYLNSRGFGYLPRLIYCDRDGYIYEYAKDVSMPKEQKANDLIKLDALLHNKTVYYKETSLDETKEIYENLTTKISNTFNYYDDLITMIEGKVFMSPAEYLLARNASSFFSCINFCQKELDDWYKITSTQNKKREVLLHNNLDINHIYGDNDDVLISWDKAVRDLPIYDFISFYKKNYDKYDFNMLYKEYVKKFPLLEEEKMLMYVILLIPRRIDFKASELASTLEVGKLCKYLYITDELFTKNEAKNSVEKNQNVDEKQKDIKSSTQNQS